MIIYRLDQVGTVDLLYEDTVYSNSVDVTKIVILTPYSNSVSAEIIYQLADTTDVYLASKLSSKSSAVKSYLNRADGAAYLANVPPHILVDREQITFSFAFADPQGAILTTETFSRPIVKSLYTGQYPKPPLNDVYTKEETDELLDRKQNTLVSGQNITSIQNVNMTKGGNKNIVALDGEEDLAPNAILFESV